MVRASAEDLRSFAELEKAKERRRKSVADLFFLVGLLAGGPILVAGRGQAGLFLVLGGALASLGRRYTALSTAAAALIGFLTSAVVAAVIVEPGTGVAESAAGAEAERLAYARELATRYEPDGVSVAARGPGSITIWFQIPAVDSVSCGAIPLPPERDRLDALRYVRVVVAAREETGRLCTFRP